MAQSPAGPVHLWYTRCGAATASALAIRQGWLQAEFARDGTILHSLRDSDSLELRNAHFHHKQSGLFREGGNIPPIWAKGIGQDTVVVAITWLDEYQGVIVKADSDIHELANLKGKRLAIPDHAGAVIDFQRGAAQHGFTTALKLAGLGREGAHFVDIKAESYDTQPGPRIAREYRHVELDALNSGEADAIFVRFARGYQLAKSPLYRQLLNINDLEDPLLRVNNGTPRPVTVDRPFLEKHPDIVARYLAVLLRTATWAAEHPAEVVNLLLPEGGGVSAEDIVGSHGKDVHLSFTPTLSEEYIRGLEVQKDFLHEWGYFTDDFDIRDWVVHEPLEAASTLVEAQLRFGNFPDNIAA
ncbi:ABC transporter substrate-binding protein [Methylobacillus flagellatus]|uniref:Thermophilic desulfurizing enzyme, TdsB protein n=1 Tax=Methylobacillus flagellatus (strain ATCC 51484 / DSM 6875 / VKM B-1610 / KT) TaxID=265072 RepID=Q1H123_METFK|nr:ABC transporter substrate-binding protein [Methylobacillus flagellatus]ABE49814.1 thermophilic desulfurizing enzyme, TdsB protein [Methylobacillus flagellatus KT]